MVSRYNAVLDIYALTATYPPEANSLREVTQLTALAFLLKKARKTELVTLLDLARDLGYIRQDIYEAHTHFLT